MVGIPEQLDALERARMFDAFERAAAHAGLALFVVHVDAEPPRVLFASELVAQIHGRSLAEITGRSVWDLVAPAERERVRELMATRRHAGAPPITLQFSVERPDGSVRDIEVGVARITAANAELAVCYFRDTTDERRALRESRQSEARFSSLVANAPDGVVIVQEGRIALANAAAVKLVGARDIDEVRGRLLTELLSPEDGARAMQRLARSAAGAPQGPAEYRNLRGDIVVEVHSVPYELDDKPATLAFVRDITERKRLQSELERADRLAALGTMAATVAHEINNPLTYLRLSLQRLQRDLDDSGASDVDALREHVANALHGADRIARIVRDLRARTRPDAALEVADEPREVDLAVVVDRALKMVDHDLRHRAQLVRNIAPDIIVRAVAARLEQVVVNVLVNAIQSLEGDGKHTITVDVDVDVDADADACDAAAGGDARIRITDTGRGIADRARIFEPFFTTKPHEGMGLGLSISREIVAALGGRIEVDSAPGVGTCVTIALPRAQRGAAAVEAAVADDPVSSPTPRLRVLVVDDDELVRRVTRMALSRHHDMEEADGGGAALQLIGARSFDVILCDLMMPDVTGRELYEEVRARWPGMERRFVFVTAGAFVPSLASFLASVDNLRLTKPFAVEQALDVVRQAHQRPP